MDEKIVDGLVERRRDGWCHDPSTMQPDTSKYGAKENASGCFAQRL